MRTVSLDTSMSRDCSWGRVCGCLRLPAMAGEPPCADAWACFASQPEHRAEAACLAVGATDYLLLIAAAKGFGWGARGGGTQSKGPYPGSPSGLPWPAAVRSRACHHSASLCVHPVTQLSKSVVFETAVSRGGEPGKRTRPAGRCEGTGEPRRPRQPEPRGPRSHDTAAGLHGAYMLPTCS